MSTPIDYAEISKLIEEKRFEEAKAILKQSNDFEAQRWLVRIEQLSPTLTPLRYTSTSYSQELEDYPRDRGGCLSIWLVLASVANPLLGLYILCNGAYLSRMLYPHNWLVLLLVMGAILNTIFVFGIWQWQKWGVQGFISLSILGFFLNLFTSGLNSGTIGGLLGTGIVWFLVRDKWDLFE
jgi:hypothetical protein